MSTVHVLPLGDDIEHLVPGGIDTYTSRGYGWLAIEAIGDDDRICPCRPTTEHVPGEDGPDGWVVTHNCLDGNEVRKPNRIMDWVRLVWHCCTRR